MFIDENQLNSVKNKIVMINFSLTIMAVIVIETEVNI